MPKLSVYNISGQPTGEEIELNEVVFGVEFKRSCCTSSNRNAAR